MRHPVRLSLFLLALAACGGEDAAAPTTRCDLCGMVVAEDSGWRAGGTGADGEALAFDTPKCLFRHRHERGEVNEPWVIEYDSQTRRPAAELVYVLGSDVEGPMGRDLVPLASRARATGFSADHAGDDVLAFDEVTAEVVGALFQPRP